MTAYTATTRRRIVDARYRREYILKQVRGVPTSLVPADRAAAHIGRLLDLGWSGTALEQMTGMAVTSATLINLRGMTYERIGRATAASALAIPYTLAPNEHVADESLIPTLGGQRRVQALMRLGWSHAAMEDVCGFNTTHFVRATYAQTLTRRWRAVDDMFRSLSMTLGPSCATMARAEQLGYAPPLAWSNIDDPDERPSIGRDSARYRAEDLAAEWAHLRQSGTSMEMAARQLGVTVGAIERAIKRAEGRAA